MLSRLITRKEQLVLLSLAGAIAAGSLTLYFLRGKPDLPTPAPETKTEHPVAKPDLPMAPPPTPVSPALVPPVSAPAPPPAPDVTVSVTGAVAKPGVYTLEASARVQDLLAKAGGALENANTEDLNLAARLLDGTTLSVPAKPVWDAKTRQFQYQSAAPSYNPPQYTRSGWTPATAPPQTAATAAAGAANTNAPLNLNTATQDQLEALPGIGPKLAQQIIAHRKTSPFKSVEDLDKVPGFGPRKLDQVRNLVSAH